MKTWYMYTMFTLGVMAHWCSILGPQNRSWVQTQWNVGETLISILPMACQVGFVIMFPQEKTEINQ